MEAGEAADRLYRLMGDWDRFEAAAHGVAEILSMLGEDGLGEVGKRFDVWELYSSARHYIHILIRILALLEMYGGIGPGEHG